MFTGIIEHCGVIVLLESELNKLKLGIKCAFHDLQIGESIAVDGICLTVTEIQEAIFYCDVSTETQQVTTSNIFKLNQSVNLERAMLPTTSLGGHFVMGHIDQVGLVKLIRPQAEFIEMVFSVITEASQNYLLKKGSIAVNGVSLTINDVNKDEFSVMLIPHTLKSTNLSHLKENDLINLEFDMLTRVLVQQCQNYLAQHNIKEA